MWLNWLHRRWPRRRDAPGLQLQSKRWSHCRRLLQRAGLVVVFVLFWLSECWRDINGGFWDPVLVRVEDNEEDEEKEEEEGGLWTSTSWAGCFGPESWSRPGWSLQSERRQRTPEEETQTDGGFTVLVHSLSESPFNRYQVQFEFEHKKNWMETPASQPSFVINDCR